MRVFERGWLSSNNILFLGRDLTALVDSGYVSHADQTLALVRYALAGRSLDLLLNTHLHSDHCGGNAILQKTYRCRTLIPAGEVDRVAAWREDQLNHYLTGQRCDRFGFDSGLAAGDTVMLGDLSWQALAAPAHDPHGLVLYCAREGILLSADALWENGFGVIFPELEGEPGYGATRATLQMIHNLELRLVIPGHGPPFSKVSDALARAWSRMDYLETDPARTARHAIKVLLKFLLLEHQRIALASVAQRLESIHFVREANRRYLQMSAEDLQQWAVTALIKSNAARLENDMLVNCT